MLIPITKVPPRVRRRAAQYLESLRETGPIAGEPTAHLGTHAVPVSRPDAAGVAWYEFSVVRDSAPARGPLVLTRQYPVGLSGNRLAAAVAHDPAPEDDPIGFIVVTNDRHQVPLARWKSGGDRYWTEAGRSFGADIRR